MAVSLTQVAPAIFRIRIERPQVRNALNWNSMEAFKQAVDEAHQVLDLRALIVTGAEATFSSGGDLKELADYRSESDGQRLTTFMSQTLHKLAQLPCPTIAAINGPTRGGGAEIALACDLRVMAADADLGLVHIHLGLTPGWGGGQRLLHLVGYSRALEWLSTGKVLSAEEADAAGLVNYVVPEGESWNAAFSLAQSIANKPPHAVRAVKFLLSAGLNHSSREAAEIEQSLFPELWAADVHHALVEDLLSRKRS